MWIYSTTVATTVASSSLSYSSSASTYHTSTSSAHNTDAAFGDVRDGYSHSSSASLSEARGPYETRRTVYSGQSNDQTGSYSNSATSGSGGATNCDQGTTDFSQNLSGGTSAVTWAFTRSSSPSSLQPIPPTGVSTFLLTWSTSAVRPSYLSGTQTVTSATTGATTTSTTATTTRHTTATGGNTQSTTATTSIMTTTTAATTATVSTYATAASTTIAAASAVLAPVTEAAADEELWQITATAESAGYVSNLGETFTRRTGTVATAATIFPVDDRSAYAIFTTTFSTLVTTTVLTVDTTETTTSADTYCPFGGRYPATATATRSFTLLTVVPTTQAQNTWVTTSGSFAGRSAGVATALQLVRSSSTAGMPVAWNQAPTVTATVELCVTISTSTLVPGVPRGVPFASSSSATAAESQTGVSTQVSSYSTSSYTTTTASVVTNFATATETTATVTATLTQYNGTATVFFIEPCAITYDIVMGFTSADLGGYTEVTLQTVTHDAPNSHSVSRETWISSTYVVTEYSTYSYSFTGSLTWNTTINASTTRSTSKTAAYTVTQGGSTTAIEGVSLTYALLQPQVTQGGNAVWSAGAFHQAGGHQLPLALGVNAPLYTAQGVMAASFAWSGGHGTQLAPAGALTPMLWSEAQTFALGASLATAQWVPSLSALALTTGSTHTATTTAGATSVTVTITVTTAISSFSDSFAAGTPGTYFSHLSTTEASQGSRIGGRVGNSQFSAGIIFGPGVRHSTRQSAGSSVAATSWWTDWELVAASSVGLALPCTAESAYSVLQTQTGWNLGSGYGVPSFQGSTGASALPVVAFSQYPNF